MESRSAKQEKLHLIERIRRTGDQMRLDIAIDDPKTFTKQIAAFKTYHLVPKGELKEDVLCGERYGRLGLDLEPASSKPKKP